MSSGEDQLLVEQRAVLFALTTMSRDSKVNKPIAELIYETPCPHMQDDFKPCLATLEVYKYKYTSKMAEIMGFPSETHKLVKVCPKVEEGEKGSFPCCVLELNFGSKKLMSSGSYMRCLECAGFRDDQMTLCSDTYTVCVSHAFLVKAAKTFVDTIRFFGPRKCNCQSYAYYLLNILGVSTEDLLKDKVVETAGGYIRDKVKQLAKLMGTERPTCPGDPNPLRILTKPIVVEPLPIPSTLEQFELDEFNDPVGRRYLHLFMGVSALTASFIFALIALFLYFVMLHSSFRTKTFF
uniref:Uncharacterized protein n=1 Tax=Spumella elongata TaxID=89044 RepID=A0A7S3GV03_9STRA|mmetsp:Transcript_20646/g.35797  ORF Transcript_20646/g.35797 Transcript_20646/m.35797 type:complete len:294 (+) Transcript_20646:55-936(+)|eukprot:CAMPEP_0184996534 /NCGR_PEP_ID=MMETSP1098-20130426/56796_1 /TAXON_ID=89044 /ORGANISM="Spumella elongata, Strain CCAP 955/1" /LENGTH=293 /DNA_ID=CAMNT_0027523001 /DNA_START=55 /DNA_END=936 /DNA_ORIENTATION=+